MGPLLLFYKKNISCIRVIDLQPTLEAIKKGICSLSKLIHTERSLKASFDFRMSYKHIICYGYAGETQNIDFQLPK